MIQDASEACEQRDVVHGQVSAGRCHLCNDKESDVGISSPRKRHPDSVSVNRWALGSDGKETVLAFHVFLAHGPPPINSRV